MISPKLKKEKKSFLLMMQIRYHFCTTKLTRGVWKRTKEDLGKMFAFLKAPRALFA